jgi:hypothetical protein
MPATTSAAASGLRSAWPTAIRRAPLGTSGGNPGPARYASAGEELTANSGSASAVTTFLWRQDASGGAWYSSWPGAYIVSDNPPFGSWTTSGYSASFYSNCGFLAPPAPDPGPTFTPFSAAGAPAALRSVISGLTAANGEPKPAAVDYVLTTRAAANKLVSQAEVDTDQPVYLLSVRGAFNGHGAKVPAGAAKPTGSVLTATIDPATGRVVDWGIEDTAPRLAALGPVRQLA